MTYRLRRDNVMFQHGLDLFHIKRSAACSTRGGSQGTYITFASAMQIRQPTLALKPRGDVTRNPKQGYQWPQNRTCECVCQKYLKKKKSFVVTLLIELILSPLRDFCDIACGREIPMSNTLGYFIQKYMFLSNIYTQ